MSLERNVVRREFHPPHIYIQETCYFITASIVRGQWLMKSDAKRALFRDILREAVQRWDVRLFAWAVMYTHYHLLLETGKTEPIHKFIKALHGDSAVRFNKLDVTPGRHVWYQYWDRCPRNEREFWTCFNYINLNAIKHGVVQVVDGVVRVEGDAICIAPGHVPDVHDCLAAYPYSSYHYYAREYGLEFLTDAFRRYPAVDILACDAF